MSKVQSPVEKWPGSVTLCDPLTVPQVFAIEDALDEIEEIDPSIFKSVRLKDAAEKVKKEKYRIEMRWSSRLNYAHLPAVLLCVESWDLENFPKPTRDTFPSIQSADSSTLISALFDELMKIYKEGNSVPNE